MIGFIEILGEFFDWVIGDRETRHHTGEKTWQQITLRPSLADEAVAIGVTVTQITYETRYKRWWLPTTTHSVYHVLAFAPASVREGLNPQLFEPQIYPMLCNGLLKHTRYPHVYALHAFLDRMGPFYPTIKCEM